MGRGTICKSGSIDIKLSYPFTSFRNSLANMIILREFIGAYLITCYIIFNVNARYLLVNTEEYGNLGRPSNKGPQILIGPYRNATHHASGST